MLSSDAFEVVAIARQRIEDMLANPHDDDAIAWGIVFELLAADFLASGWIDQKAP